MGEAKRDGNFVPTLLAVSNSDGVTPITLYADPTTHRLLTSAVAGSLDNLTDVVITGEAQGDILYRNATQWVNLAAGTDGHFLKTQGAGANPTWAAPTATAAPGGSDTQMQFNDAGTLAGDAGFTYNKTSNVGTIGGMNVTGLTASEIVGTDASKNLVSLAVATYPSLTELTYVKGVTSAIQTQIGTKAPSTSPTFATSITGSYLTASEFLITDGSKNIVSAPVATYPSLTELSYVKGVTSGIQSQINAKGVGDMVLASVQSVTGLKTFDTTKLAVKGSSTGTTAIASANAGASNYTLTLPAVTGTLVTGGGTASGTNTGDNTVATALTGSPTIEVTAINLGHASDTTIARVSAGVASIEGKNIALNGTSETLTTGTIELGAASDTTISRSAAGVLAVEGVVIPSISSTNTFTNKRVTRRVVTVNAPGATPTTNTDNGDIFEFTGLNTAITSMTSSLSGTPSNGDLKEFIFVDDGTARAITWSTGFANGGLVNLPSTTVISTPLRVLVQYQTIASLNKFVCIAIA